MMLLMLVIQMMIKLLYLTTFSEQKNVRSRFTRDSMDECC